MKNRRLFIGIPIEEKASEKLHRIQSTWKEILELSSGSLVSRSDFHITLHFLGAIEEGQIDLWIESLEQHVRSAKFSFELNRFLAFPNIQKARVITLAGASGNSPLSQLFYQTRKTVEGLGSKMETRVFVPHVTLFRAKELKITQSLEVGNPVKIKVTSFALFESQSGHHENRYRVLKEFDLTTS